MHYFHFEKGYLHFKMHYFHFKMHVMFLQKHVLQMLRKVKYVKVGRSAKARQVTENHGGDLHDGILSRKIQTISRGGRLLTKESRTFAIYVENTAYGALFSNRFTNHCRRMKVNEQTLQKIARALRKAAAKFPAEVEALPLTDIYLQIKQESGELLVFNDDDEELTRCVVDEWIGNTSEDFYDEVQEVLSGVIAANKAETEHFNILKPYSFVLTGEDHETIADLYLVDDETILLSGELMEGLSEDLDRFWADLEQN